jgi:hypothetical protein
MMKVHSVLLSIFALCLMLLARPAMAQEEQTYYENGPVNGQVNARIINFGNAVTDSFPNNGLLILDGVSFWLWTFPGDTVENVQVSLGSTPFGIDEYDTVFNPGSGQDCFVNNFGYHVCRYSLGLEAFPDFARNWLTLRNANATNGDPVYWDQNAGVGCMSQGCPSQALEKADGQVPRTATIPSETFSMTGHQVVGAKHK